MWRLLCSACATRDARRAPPPPQRRRRRSPPPPPPRPPPRLPQQAAEPASATHAVLQLSLMGPHPHPDAIEKRFEFRGASFVRAAAITHVRCALAADSEALFAWCAEWLCEPVDAIRLLLHTAGGAMLNAASTAGRTVAEVGLAGARYAVVLLAPRCGICFETRACAPYSAMLLAGGPADDWSCPTLATAGSRTPTHYYCSGCMKRYLDTMLSPAGADGPAPARLRCPQPGCPRVVPDGYIGRLLGGKRLAAYQAARAARYAGRLHAVRSGAEGGDGLARWTEAHAQACPACAVLVSRAEGCRNMQCLCGAVFYWQKQL